MVESRCGILCKDCAYRESMGCTGCTHIDKPFWGDTCPVKSCCEGKGYSHCGLCAEMPCAQLTEFAYAQGEGDNGKRIEQCKKWAAM